MAAATLLVTSVGCGTQEDTTEARGKILRCAQDDDMRGPDGGMRARDGSCMPRDFSLLDPDIRRLVGAATPYTLVPVARDIHTNMKTRRTHGWKVFESINRQVPLAEENWSVPVWQTWFDQEEFSRIFTTLFRELTPAQRSARAPFNKERVRQLLTSWGRSSKRVATFEPLSDAKGFAGVHGKAFEGVQVSRTLFSPAFVEHFLIHYKAALDCTSQQVARFPDSYQTPDPANFSVCFGEEFPADATMIKAVFFENDESMPVFDSSAATLKRAFSQGNWVPSKSVRPSAIGDDRMFSVYFDNDTTYRLAGLHVVTKEVREWVWATYWWSEAPRADFGADRDEIVRAAIDPAFRHYKMCVATHFVEGDKKPYAHYEKNAATLAASLKSASDRFNATTWCANPYLEGTFPNTNCIGCHQFAGTAKTFDDRRTQVRKNFPADFTFAFSRFRRAIENAVRTNAFEAE